MRIAEADRTLPAGFRLVHVEPDDVHAPVLVDRERGEHARVLLEERRHGSAGLEVIAPEAHRALPARVRQVQVQPDDVHPPVLLDRERGEDAGALLQERRHRAPGHEVALAGDEVEEPRLVDVLLEVGARVVVADVLVAAEVEDGSLASGRRGLPELRNRPPSPTACAPSSRSRSRPPADYGMWNDERMS